MVDDLTGAWGAMERIGNTPLPFAYVAHLRTTLVLYLGLWRARAARANREQPRAAESSREQPRAAKIGRVTSTTRPRHVHDTSTTRHRRYVSMLSRFGPVVLPGEI